MFSSVDAVRQTVCEETLVIKETEPTPFAKLLHRHSEYTVNHTCREKQ